MFSGIPLDLLGDLGWAGVVVLAVLLILNGKLVPKSTLDRETADKQYWRDTAQIAQENNGNLIKSLNELTEAAKISERVMESIQKKNEEEGG